MHSLTAISDQQLIDNIQHLCQTERRLTLAILNHLREIEIRRLYVDLKYSSMYEYAIKHLKYSEGQAHRRLSAARLLKEIPEIAESIIDGSLSLTNISKVQSFIRAEKTKDRYLSKNQKKDIVTSILNTPTRDVEKHLLKESSQPQLLAEKFFLKSADSLNELSRGENFIKIEVYFNEPQQMLLNDFKSLFAHELKDTSNGSVFTHALEKSLNKKRKEVGLSISPSAPKALVRQRTSTLLPLQQTTDTNQTSSIGSNHASIEKNPPLRASISVKTKKSIWQRAQGQCEHVNSSDRQRCLSKIALEIDHIQPVALGGLSDLNNLRLLCQNHNQRRAIKTFGLPAKK